MTEADWDKMHTVNLKRHVFLVKAALRVMEKQNKVEWSLPLPLRRTTGYPGWSHYGASKAGTFMRSAALEYAHHGITINAVMPGNILTGGLVLARSLHLNQMKASIPTTLGEPEDIGYAPHSLRRMKQNILQARQLSSMADRFYLNRQRRCCRSGWKFVDWCGVYPHLKI